MYISCLFYIFPELDTCWLPTTQSPCGGGGASESEATVELWVWDFHPWVMDNMSDDIAMVILWSIFSLVYPPAATKGVWVSSTELAEILRVRADSIEHHILKR